MSPSIEASSKGHALDDIFEKGSVDPIYHAKARVLNEALQEIGMGTYQVCPTYDTGSLVTQVHWFRDISLS